MIGKVTYRPVWPAVSAPSKRTKMFVLLCVFTDVTLIKMTYLLATQGKTFHFSLNMGTNFSFSFSKKEGKPLNAEEKCQAENRIPQQEEVSPFHCGLLSGCWLLILL